DTASTGTSASPSSKRAACAKSLGDVRVPSLIGRRPLLRAAYWHFGLVRLLGGCYLEYWPLPLDLQSLSAGTAPRSDSHSDKLPNSRGHAAAMDLPRGASAEAKALRPEP